MCENGFAKSDVCMTQRDYKSFAHLFKQYTLGQAVVDDAKLDHIFLVPEDLSV